MPIGIKGFQKGQVFTDEHRQKISMATTKYRTGIHHTVETIEKLREKKLGKLNPNWNGGSSTESKCFRMSSPYRQWRKRVFERDNYTCQSCGIVGFELHPHHIKEFAQYKELRLDIENGITLCYECHKRVHSHKF